MKNKFNYWIDFCYALDSLILTNDKILLIFKDTNINLIFFIIIFSFRTAINKPNIR